jgi:hypothetical protein
LVAGTQPGNKLERRNTTIENYDNGRSVRWRRTSESTSQCIGQSLTGIPWYGNELWINLKENLATKLASEANQKKPDWTPEQLVPQEYHDYLDIFNEDKANRFPDTRPWDHKIEMKSGFEPKSFKTYNLTPEEQVELDKFLKENLDKGYIKPSQSPMASPFFFVKKKDGKLWPC